VAASPNWLSSWSRIAVNIVVDNAENLVLSGRDYTNTDTVAL
jgi:hypothetical protein